MPCIFVIAADDNSRQGSLKIRGNQREAFLQPAGENLTAVRQAPGRGIKNYTGLCALCLRYGSGIRMHC